MRFTPAAALGSAVFLASAVSAQYNLSVTYDSSNFFQTWDFFSEPDPTQGFVQYLDSTAATAAGLAKVDANGKIYMGADSSTVNPVNGRQSVRMSSQQTFTHGLFLADIEHMPGSVCGSWPAWWMFGDNWPNSGEIDVIEGVNGQSTNEVTLHTSAGCVINNSGSAEGTVLTQPDCNAGYGGEGCPQKTSSNQNYGDGFNAIRGGVYAVEWTSDVIAVWFFPRSAIPADITSETPQPAAWGTPLAQFNGNAGCNIDEHFANNKLTFDITFCGAWAGNVWSRDPECSALAPTCNAYVAQNPSAFEETFWTVDSIKVFNAI